MRAFLDKQSALLSQQVLDAYINSADFNGLHVRNLGPKVGASLVCKLVAARHIDIVRGDIHPNPHIKALENEPPEVQIRKINEKGLAGCLYPTEDLLQARGIGVDEVAPYTKALKMGSPQLSFRTFDLRALEWYRSDPRFNFQIDDIHGRIYLKDGVNFDGRTVARDGLEFLEFGFAYDLELNITIAVFLRYLHDLPPEQQTELSKHELSGDYDLHPDFYRTSIIGDFPQGISYYEAFIQERFHINRICERVGRPFMFRTDFQPYNRPREFGTLLRPTRAEFRAFALLTDHLLSDDIDRKFFAGDIPLTRSLVDEDGNKESHPIGSLSLLERWLKENFMHIENCDSLVDRMLKSFRRVRQIRQKPAHKFEDNEFDQKYIKEQRELIATAFEGLRILRQFMEHHPDADGYEAPEHLRNAQIWTL